jgi:hypothetical protein
VIRAVALALALVAVVGPAGADQGSENRYALLEDLRVDESVRGDVVVLGADAVLANGARVGGDVVAVLGTVTREPGAVVQGRTVALTSLGALLTESTGINAGRTRIGLRLLTAGFWLLLATTLAAVLPVWCRRGCTLAVGAPMRTAVAAALFVATLVAGLVALLGLGPVLSMPLVTAVVLAAVVIKGIGLMLLGAFVGGKAVRRVTPRFAPVSVEVLIGVSLLLVLRFVPGVGSALWTAVSLVAVGVAAVTLLERPLMISPEWSMIGSRATGSAEVRPD